MNYIGSKLSILEYINDTVENFTEFEENKEIVFCDIFAGTSSVGKYFKNKGYSVISNDIQFYSYVMAKHYIGNNEDIKFEKLKKEGIYNVFQYLNHIKGIEGFIYSNYTVEGTIKQEHQRQYFTSENAKKIDAIRNKIEEWKNINLLEENEYYYLIACLIEAADKVANTASVYEAFLKNVKKSAAKTLEILPLEILKSEENRKFVVKNQDANELIKEISGDILYLDPPYNTRKYDTNYHILETIALNDNPQIKGKTGVREEETKKSKYCSKRDVESAFEDIIKNAKFKYILLSYNDEGILPLRTIEKIMSQYGEYTRYEKEHKRFKADNNREYSKDHTIEYIHCLKKGEKKVKYNFLSLAEEILNRTKIPMSINEIWEYAKENHLAEELNSIGKTPWKTLGARMYVDIRDNQNAKLQQLSKRPAKFGLKDIKYSNKILEKEIVENEKKQYNERDLHTLLTKFVYGNQHFRCYTKTIYHENSKRKGVGVNKWLHPDIVGVHFPYKEYSDITIELINSFNECTYRLFSFEMKKCLNFQNLREYYFQAVSNSSWANEGYLVTLEMDESEEFMDEIRRLNNAFGIGLIKLDAVNIEESEILFPSKLNEILDWDTMNRLIEENVDFKRFADSISDTKKTKKVGNEYDEVLNDEEFEKYIIDKKIKDVI